MKFSYRFIHVLLILIFSALILTSCDKDSDDDDDSNPLRSSASSPLVGTWVFVKVDVEFQGQVYTLTADEAEYHAEVTFNQDGTASWSENDSGVEDSGSGTWTAEDGRLTITNPDGTTDTVTYEIDNNTLKIINTDEEGTVTEYYDKKS